MGMCGSSESDTSASHIQCQYGQYLAEIENIECAMARQEHSKLIQAYSNVRWPAKYKSLNYDNVKREMKKCKLAGDYYTHELRADEDITAAVPSIQKVNVVTLIEKERYRTKDMNDYKRVTGEVLKTYKFCEYHYGELCLALEKAHSTNPFIICDYTSFLKKMNENSPKKMRIDSYVPTHTLEKRKQRYIRTVNGKTFTGEYKYYVCEACWNNAYYQGMVGVVYTYTGANTYKDINRQAYQTIQQSVSRPEPVQETKPVEVEVVAPGSRRRLFQSLDSAMLLALLPILVLILFFLWRKFLAKMRPLLPLYEKANPESNSEDALAELN